MVDKLVGRTGRKVSYRVDINVGRHNVGRFGRCFQISANIFGGQLFRQLLQIRKNRAFFDNNVGRFFSHKK